MPSDSTTSSVRGAASTRLFPNCSATEEASPNVRRSPRKSVAPGINRAPFNCAFAPVIPAAEALGPLAGSGVAPKADSSPGTGVRRSRITRGRQESKLRRPWADLRTAAALPCTGLRKRIFMTFTDNIHPRCCQSIRLPIGDAPNQRLSSLGSGAGCTVPGFSRTGTPACPRLLWLDRTGQAGRPVLPSNLPHYPSLSSLDETPHSTFEWRGVRQTHTPPRPRPPPSRPGHTLLLGGPASTG